MKDKIFVAVPMGSGTITGELAAFLTVLQKRGGVEFGFSGNVSPRTFARNLLAREFLASKCPVMWFFDADVIPAPNTLELLDIKADIVAGTYPVIQRDIDGENVRFHYLIKDGTGKPVTNPPETVIDAHGIPFGNALIRREVVADKRMRLDDGSEDPPAIFRDICQLNGKILETDDYEFCARARALGYTIKAHLGVRFGHRKTLDLNMFLAPALHALRVFQESKKPPDFKVIKRQLDA